MSHSSFPMGLTQLTHSNQSRDSCDIKSEEVTITKLLSKFTNRARPKVLASTPWRRLDSLHGVLFLTHFRAYWQIKHMCLMGSQPALTMLPYSIKPLLRILTRVFRKRDRLPGPSYSAICENAPLSSGVLRAAPSLSM